MCQERSERKDAEIRDDTVDEWLHMRREKAAVVLTQLHQKHAAFASSRAIRSTYAKRAKQNPEKASITLRTELLGFGIFGGDFK
jgi:hypothetical protein